MSGERVKKWVDHAEDAETREGTVGQGKPGGLPRGGGAPAGLNRLGMMGEDGKKGREAGSWARTALH